MAGVLEALIAQGVAAWPADERRSLGPFIELNDGFILVPLTDDTLRAVRGDVAATVADGFDQLDVAVVRLAEQLSRFGVVIYVNLEFHGGTGFHEAVGWRDGSIAAGPAFTANHPTEALTGAFAVVRSSLDMAINTVLRDAGVDRGEARDEFARLGLDRYRWTDDWAAAARPS